MWLCLSWNGVCKRRDYDVRIYGCMDGNRRWGYRLRTREYGRKIWSGRRRVPIYSLLHVSAQKAVILLMDSCTPVEETRVEARKYDADELTKLRSSRAECLKAVGAGAGVRAP